MSEETTETTAATVSETTTATSTPTSFIDGDGNFTEGWQEKYVPEDIRGDAVIGRVRSIQGVFKSLANFDRMKGTDNIPKPSDRFGDEDWDAFHTAGGWTNEPIKLVAPEGLPEGIWSDDRAKMYSEGFNKLRLNPKQVAGLAELHNADILQQLTDHKNNSETEMTKLKTDLLAEKGNAYTQFEHNGNFAITKGVKGDMDFQKRVAEKFGNDPDFIRLMGNLGGDFSESGSVPIKQQALTPSDIDKQLADIRSSEAFNKPMHPGHKAAMDNLARLHKEKLNIRVPA